MKAIAAIILISAAGSLSAGYWGGTSAGLDMSYLDWEHGGHLSWSFLSAFGPRLFDDVYLRAKVSIPAPLPVIIGNQISLGGEISYLPLNPEAGPAVETSLGVSWCYMWPEHVIVILADGDTSEPPPQHSFDGAGGLRLEALSSFGYRFDDVAFWLDLGIDHRIMDVERTVGGEKIRGDYTFTGLRIGISVDIYF